MKRYNLVKVRELLDLVHDLTKKTILIFMEIPSVISMEDMHTLMSKTNMSRPYLFIGIRRGSYRANGDNLYVNDWGKDVDLLRDKFLPYLNRLNNKLDKTSTNKEFRDTNAEDRLIVLEGYVSLYNHSGDAEITESVSGLKVFFRPSENNLTSSCSGHKVEFSLGFSYDGLRAHDGSVKVID